MQTVTDFAVLISMLGLMVSGIILSREVFAFLPISGGTAFARQVHILAAFWGFVLMALHLGLHWNMVLGLVRRAIGPVSFKMPLLISRMAFCAHQLVAMRLSWSFVPGMAWQQVWKPALLERRVLCEHSRAE